MQKVFNQVTDIKVKFNEGNVRYIYKKISIDLEFLYLVVYDLFFHFSISLSLLYCNQPLVLFSFAIQNRVSATFVSHYKDGIKPITVTNHYFSGILLLTHL